MELNFFFGGLVVSYLGDEEIKGWPRKFTHFIRKVKNDVYVYGYTVLIHKWLLACGVGVAGFKWFLI